MKIKHLLLVIRIYENIYTIFQILQQSGISILCLIIMKKISLFNATSRRQTRSGDRSDNKPETRRAVSNPESNDTLRKLVDVKHEVTNRTKYFITYQHY